MLPPCARRSRGLRGAGLGKSRGAVRGVGGGLPPAHTQSSEMAMAGTSTPGNLADTASCPLNPGKQSRWVFLFIHGTAGGPRDRPTTAIFQTRADPTERQQAGYPIGNRQGAYGGPRPVGHGQVTGQAKGTSARCEGALTKLLIGTSVNHR